jgi:hypothetical protein
MFIRLNKQTHTIKDNDMAKQETIKKANVQSAEELEQLLIQSSKQHPDFVIAADVTFGTARIHKFKNRSSIPVDSPTSRTMFDIFANVLCYKNGKPMKATKSWVKRNIEQENRTYNS